MEYDRDLLIPAICSRIANGETVNVILKEPGMPAHPTWCDWMREDPQASEMYARARESRADIRSDRIDEYADDMIKGKITPEQCRVAIDAQKWQAGKENPRRYADKLQHGGEVSLNILPDDKLGAEIERLLAKRAEVK